MVCVSVWRTLVLSVLCLPQRFGASVSIIERHITPTVFVTTAATPDTEPLWLVVPMLLDVQPVLLKVDVTRHVPAQIQSFCQEHGVDATRCVGAIREALDEVVNWQRFCRKPVAESALPGFIVTKNVIRDGVESASSSWLQNDPEDIATDFCGFAQAKTVASSETCVEALGQALQPCFDWMLALPPCEQQPEGGDSVTSGETATQSVADRLATVEEMIAALQSTSENGVVLAAETETTEEDLSDLFRGSAVEEISETETEENVGVHEADAPSGDLKERPEERERPTSEANDEVEVTADIPRQFTEAQKDDNTAEQDDNVESELAVGDKDSFEVSLPPPLDKRQSRIGEEKETQKSWKVGAALVLALSILYLVIDLMLHCVRYLASHIKAPNQLISVLLHDILLLVGTGPRSTLKNKGDKLKKTSGRRSQAPSGEELPQSTNTHNKLMQPQVTVPHPLTSFTCAAMLMAGRISIDSITLAQDTQTNSSFVQDSNEALAIIQQKYDQELAAALRIQSAWKAAQRKSSLKREWERVFNGICMVENSSVAVASPKKSEAQQPPALRRLASNTLPPL
ncbi:hypothetical protein V7S43_016188 [Phytophthora oleae]|uniref:Uncharacterized protein n=1 Tax=Phytophthora oleae TaxID=2107226 RepID=A0ABD3EY38_9STRA